MSKPIVRELRQASDTRKWSVTHKGLTKGVRLSSCQMACNPSGIAIELEYQIKQALKRIEREAK